MWFINDYQNIISKQNSLLYLFGNNHCVGGLIILLTLRLSHGHLKKKAKNLALCQIPIEPRHEKTGFLPNQKQRHESVTAKLISVFIFAARIVPSLCFLNPKFKACSHLL